eukprot:ctg_342.g242
MRDGGGSTERTSARQPSLPKLLTYAAGWPVYALGICCSSSGEVARLAIGSFVEDASGNGLQVVDVTLGAVGNESASSTTSGAAPPPFVERHRVSLALPPTAVQWEPTYEHLIGPESCQRLAVAGDRLRLWQVSTNAMQLLGSHRVGQRLHRHHRDRVGRGRAASAHAADRSRQCGVRRVFRSHLQTHLCLLWRRRLGAPIRSALAGALQHSLRDRRRGRAVAPVLEPPRPPLFADAADQVAAQPDAGHAHAGRAAGHAGLAHPPGARHRL